MEALIENAPQTFRSVLPEERQEHFTDTVHDRFARGIKEDIGRGGERMQGSEGCEILAHVAS